ncbi:unnamed protein product [Trifolium pratense]|uniref:Uncharacterized protein n=1 Tax=Trifolium pratense TaxID=57577 RepID=A0ACB0J0T5_TRIPR|nr:unnamed protein product [Trifolium pratense]
MAFVHESLHLLLFFLSLSACCLPSISTTYTTATLAPSTSKPNRLVSKLIHYNSIHHPHYNPNLTAEDQMILIVEQSIKRLAYLKAGIEGKIVLKIDHKPCYCDYRKRDLADRFTYNNTYADKSFS